MPLTSSVDLLFKLVTVDLFEVFEVYIQNLSLDTAPTANVT